MIRFLIDLSQGSLSSLTYCIAQTEPKILHLVKPKFSVRGALSIGEYNLPNLDLSPKSQKYPLPNLGIGVVYFSGSDISRSHYLKE